MAWLLALLATLLWGCGPSFEARPLVFLHAASTSELVSALEQAFLQETGIKVQGRSASSAALAEQILQGHGGDLFLSAHVRWMDLLQRKKLIQPGSRRIFCTNRLVLVALKESPQKVDLEGPPPSFGSLALGDPEAVPAGIYAMGALRRLGWWKSLKTRVVAAPDARAVLRLVSTGRAQVGITYGSELRAGDPFRVLAALPEDPRHPIVYSMALLAGADARAARLLRFLESAPTLSIIRRYGFSGHPGGLPQASAPDQGLWALTPGEIQAILLSLKVALFCTLLNLLPAILLGWLLARGRFVGKLFLDTLLNLPLVMPPVGVGLVMLFLLGPKAPLGHFIQDKLGLDLFNWKGAVLASTVMGFPLMLRAIRLNMELVEERLVQAARTLGASPWRVFLSVTLPLSLPGLVTGSLLCFARSLGEFGATITFVSSVQGVTTTLPLAMWQKTQLPGGETSALRLLLVSLLLALLAMYLGQVLARRSRALRHA